MKSNNYDVEVKISKFNYDLAHKLNVQAQTEIDRINQRVGIFTEKSIFNYAVQYFTIHKLGGADYLNRMKQFFGKNFEINEKGVFYHVINIRYEKLTQCVVKFN